MDPAPKLPVKYRASCDRCYLAKVKCSKERPTCPRCENLGLACSYSPSQRTGKSRRTKIRGTLSALQDSESQTAFSSQPSPVVPTNTSIQSFERSSLQPDSGSPHSQSNMTLATWPSSETIMHDLDVNFLAPWDDYLPISEEDNRPTFQISEGLMGCAAAIQSPSREHQVITTADSPGQENNHHTCNCFNSLMHALHAMQKQVQHHVLTLETMLIRSKDVTTHGEKLLRCTCIEDSTLTMLFAALIAKYLSLYNSDTIDVVCLPSSTSTADTPINSSRLTVGRHTIDMEDEERLRMEIMSIELQKLNTLLTKLRGKFSALPVSYEAHMYETVLNSLNTRLREAMSKLQRQKLKLIGEA
nr:GAL4-like zn2-cys6 binuclear cluster domain protein [Cladonia metacorallifera]